MIGRELVRQLVSQGHETFGLVRNKLKVGVVERLGAQVVLGDIMNREDCERATRSVDMVFHLAARVSLEGDRLVRPPMVKGTSNMLAACRNNGVGKFVYTSSVSVYGDARGEWVEETSPFEADTAYGRAKVEAENLVTRATDEGWLDTVILRPSWVYSVDDVIFRLMRMGKVNRWIGAGDNWWGFVHREDVARAFILAASRAEAVGKKYIVSDDKPATWRDYLEYLANLLGVSPPGATSRSLAMVSALVGSLLARLEGRSQLDFEERRRPLITPDTVRSLRASTRFSNRRIKEELGFSFNYPDYREGLRQLVVSLAKS